MNPLAGYAMLLRTRGRRSGASRFAPLNYAIVDGAVYCLAGFGRRTHWFRNLCAEPRVAVRLPLRWIEGVAEEVTDPDERLRAVRAVLHAAGWAGFLVGANPWSAPDDVLRAKTAGLPVVRVRRVDGDSIVPGPADPGGWLWVPIVGAQLWFARRLRRRLVGSR
jgi:deazaflavin-dependent oxidoreductase (nitroreductase family)